MLDETLWRVKSIGFLHVNLDWFIVLPKLGHTFSREQPELFQDFVPKTYSINFSTCLLTLKDSPTPNDQGFAFQQDVFGRLRSADDVTWK